MRTSATAAVLAMLTLAAMAASVQAQGSPSAPAFVTDTNTLYCHSSEDALSVWANLLEADGVEGPYQIYGEAAFTDPVEGIGIDPVTDEDFVTRIALSPALAQDITLEGKVTVHAFIGSGAYGGGRASIGTSLAIDGKEVGAAAAKDHTMTPKNSNAPTDQHYDAIEWTFDLPKTDVKSGSTLEWVLSGTVTVGNNVFLACHELRGRSSIDLPVTYASAADVGNVTLPGNATGNETGNATSNSTVSVSASATLSSSATTTTSTTNSTTNATADKKGAPALPAALTTLTLVGLAVAVRRRLR